jgi:hypothetical protein
LEPAHFKLQVRRHARFITDAADAVFGMKESLVAQFDRHPPGAGPNGEIVETQFYTVNYDFRLRVAGAAETVKA